MYLDLAMYVCICSYVCMYVYALCIWIWLCICSLYMLICMYVHIAFFLYMNYYFVHGYMLKKMRGVIDDDEGSRVGREVERGRGEKKYVIRDEGHRGVERGTRGREN